MSHAASEKTDAILALHGDAKAYPGGIAALAALIGRSAGVDDLMAAQLEMMRRFGELAAEFTEARADAVITPDEFSALKVAGQRLVRSVLSFVHEIGTQVQTPAEGGAGDV